MSKKSFILYLDQKDLFECMSNEQAGALIKHIFMYVNGENPETNDPFIKIGFASVKAALKRDLTKYQEIIEKRSHAGKMSAKTKANTKKQNEHMLTHVNKRQQTPTKSTVNVNDNVNDSVNVNDNVNVNKKKKGAAGINPAPLNRYSEYVDAFMEFYTFRTEMPYYFKAIDGKAIKDIIRYLEKIAQAKNKDPVEVWKFILSQYDKWEIFYQKQLKPNQINSNLPNILNNLRNGNSKKDKYEDAADIITELHAEFKAQREANLD